MFVCDINPIFNTSQKLNSFTFHFYADVDVAKKIVYKNTKWSVCVQINTEKNSKEKVLSFFSFAITHTKSFCWLLTIILSEAF